MLDSFLAILVTLGVPITLYILLLATFAVVACFSKKHGKRALKVLTILVRARVRSG